MLLLTVDASLIKGTLPTATIPSTVAMLSGATFTGAVASNVSIANQVIYSLSAGNFNTGTSAGAGLAFQLADSSGSTVGTPLGYIHVVKTGAWTAGSAATQTSNMVFIFPDGATQREAMRFVAGGRVLVGTTVDDGATRLQVSGNLKATGFVGDGSSLTGITATQVGAAAVGVANNFTATQNISTPGTIQLNVNSTDTTAAGLSTISMNLLSTTSVQGPGALLRSVKLGAWDGTIAGYASALTVLVNQGTTGNANEVARFIGNGQRMLLGTTVDDGVNQLQVVGSIKGSGFVGSGAQLTALPAAQLVGSLPAISGAALTGIPYDTTGGYEGKPTATVSILILPVVRAFTLAAAASHRGTAKTAATASTTFDIRKNGTSIGSMVWAASATTPTFTGSATAFAIGDILEIVSPAQDATLANIGFTLAGNL